MKTESAELAYLIGLDLGSSSIRAVAFDLRGKLVAFADRPSTSAVPDKSQPGHIVWPVSDLWRNVCAVLKEMLAGLSGGTRIEAICVACLGMDGVPVDQSGRALFDFISWQDSRCVEQYERWLETFGSERQFSLTGASPVAFSTLFRLQWMAENHSDLLARAHKWMLMGDYINLQLCDVWATDYSMAACTLMFDPGSKSWHQDILKASGVRPALLCEAKASGAALGAVSGRAAQSTGLPEGTPVVLGGHDYLCGVLPVGGHQPGKVVNVAGTWDVIQATLAEFQVSPQAGGRNMTFEPHVAPGMYSVCGAAINGAVTNWYRSQLASHAHTNDRSWFALCSQAAARDGQGLMFLPHLSGATGPIVDIRSAGALVGLKGEHSSVDILAAVFEGLSFQTKEIVDSMQECDIQAEKFVMIGGSTKSSSLVQTRADILGLPVEVFDVPETSALGAAMLAGIGVGIYADIDEAYSAVQANSQRYEPDPSRQQLFSDRFGLYKQLYGSLLPIHRELSRF